MSLWNKTDSQLGQPKFVRVGQLTAINVSGTMTGYTSGSFTISAPPAGGVQAVATYVAAGGVITSVTITNPGAGYTSAPTVTAAGGSGAVISASIKQPSVPNSEVVLVSREEAALASNRAKGIRGPGWYRVTEKVQSDGTLRYITESLVAMDVTNAVAGDTKGDDLVVGDVEISITTQPVGVTVAAPTATSFTVVASGATTYQWQVQVNGIGAYTNIVNGGVYSTATTATLNISDSTGLNRNRYRCVCGNGGTAQATSNGARLTVTA